jgi:hypothetical protein
MLLGETASSPALRLPVGRGVELQNSDSGVDNSSGIFLFMREKTGVGKILTKFDNSQKKR